MNVTIKWVITNRFCLPGTYKSLESCLCRSVISEQYAESRTVILHIPGPRSFFSARATLNPPQMLNHHPAKSFSLLEICVHSKFLHPSPTDWEKQKFKIFDIAERCWSSSAESTVNHDMFQYNNNHYAVSQSTADWVMPVIHKSVYRFVKYSYHHSVVLVSVC